jgi:hypothetical protein
VANLAGRSVGIAAKLDKSVLAGIAPLPRTSTGGERARPG